MWKAADLNNFLNECATLKSRHKYTPLVLDMVGPSLKCDLGTCLWMSRAKDGTGKDRIAPINLIFDNRVVLNHEQVVRATTSEGDAKGIEKVLNHNKDARDMCDYDKIST